jgi:hypothetical protein
MIEKLENLLPDAITKTMTAAMSEADQNDKDVVAYAECGSHDLFLLPCFAHTLQLAVQKGLNVCKNIDVAIGTFRDLLRRSVTIQNSWKH